MRFAAKAQSTALAVAVEVTKNVSDLNANLHDHINALATAIGRSDLTYKPKEEDSNG